MKQRLGIAHALLGDPSVLILDEPANGLDPAGIRWMRGLLKGYADRGGTVLLSSHLLNEVELIADEMVLIGRGRIVAQGTKESLLAGADHRSTHVTSLDNELLAKVLTERGHAVAAAGQGLRVEAAPVEIGRAAAEHAVVLTDLRAAEGGLEDLFLSLTSDTQRDVLEGSAVMSATIDAGSRPSPAPSTSARARTVPMGRLAKVELRKALDTRAGRWFTIAILALVLVVQVIYAFAAPEDALGYGDFLSVAGGVLGYFMPILIIMLVTSEASQRNGLVTFTLEPRRSRVVVAKFLAGFALAFAVMVLAALIAVVGTLLGIATGAEADWSVDGNLLFNGFVLANVIGVLIGFAIATLLMNTPAAIVGYFAYSLILPIAVGILGSLSSGFADVAPWIEFNTAQTPLFTGDYTPTGEEWAQIAVSGTIWLVVPLALGIARLLRIEFK